MTLGRRFWIKAAVVALAPLGIAHTAWGQSNGGNNAAERLDERNVVSLEDQLKNGLRTANAGQVRFVKIVVTYVNRGKIPRAMVNLVYTWALEKNPSVPFPYFQFAMRELSKRRGVRLP